VYLISGFLFFLKIIDLPSAGCLNFFSRIWTVGGGYFNVFYGGYLQGSLTNASSDTLSRLSPSFLPNTQSHFKVPGSLDWKPTETKKGYKKIYTLTLYIDEQCVEKNDA
jgi:hypothetical protein